MSRSLFSALHKYLSHEPDPAGRSAHPTPESPVTERPLRQSKKMLLTAGQLPDIFICLVGDAAHFQGSASLLLIIFYVKIQARKGRVIQNRRPYDLIFEILIHISDFLRQITDFTLSRVKTSDDNLSFHVARCKMRDQTVECLTESGFPAAVVSNDCEKISCSISTDKFFNVGSSAPG